MAGGFSLQPPGLTPLDMLNLAPATPNAAVGGNKTKAHDAAQNFEAVFLNSMFDQMSAGVNGDGPFGGSGATRVWRSLLTDAYARSFAKAGGIGIASHVYQQLMALQEHRS